jgi:hypothetical protein
MISTNGDVDELAQRAVGQRHGRQISRLGQLRAAPPSPDPMSRVSIGGNRKASGGNHCASGKSNQNYCGAMDEFVGNANNHGVKRSRCM